jgi:hypothetical protein
MASSVCRLLQRNLSRFVVSPYPEISDKRRQRHLCPPPHVRLIPTAASDGPRPGTFPGLRGRVVECQPNGFDVGSLGGRIDYERLGFG